MRIDLLRHGEIERKNAYCGVTDDKLTNVGWQQMIKSSQPAGKWKIIISSPLKRCKCFAEYLSKSLGVPMIVDERWQEMDFGNWDGLSAEEIMRFDENLLKLFWSNPLNYSPPFGEPLKDVQKRVLQAWQDVVKTKKNVLVVTHGGPIRVVTCHQDIYPIQKLMDIKVGYAEMKSFDVFNYYVETVE